MSAAAEITWTPLDSDAEFRSLFDNAPLAVAKCQRQGTITALNPAFERLLGTTLSAADPLHFSDLICDENSREPERLLTDLFDGTRNSLQIECGAACNPSGKLRWTLWRIPGTNCAESAMISVEEILENPGEHQRMQQAARLEAVGRLAGGVAHDFNNLLTGVLLYCDLLLATIDSDHRARKYADEIRKAGIQASGLVRQLLALSRPPNFLPRALSLNEIAEGMRSLLGRLIGENIELQFRLDASLGLVQMDPTQAQQILLNLVLNARDAMPKGGHIAVETRTCKVQVLTESEGGETSLPCALFSVTDGGNGMDAYARAHLFEPFFTTKAGKGTGLGLATVHDIVVTNGGLIHVSSEPGRGTRITVLLPLVGENTSQPATHPDFKPVDNGELLSYKNVNKKE